MRQKIKLVLTAFMMLVVFVLASQLAVELKALGYPQIATAVVVCTIFLLAYPVSVAKKKIEQEYLEGLHGKD